jgi:hypothetical protein
MLRIVPLSLPREKAEEFRIEIAVRIRMMRRKRKGRDSPSLKHLLFPFNSESTVNQSLRPGSLNHSPSENCENLMRGKEFCESEASEEKGKGRISPPLSYASASFWV